MSDAPIADAPASSAAPAPQKPKRKPIADERASIKADLADLISAAGDKLPPSDEVEALAARCDSAGVRRQVADVLRNALLESGDVAKASLRLALAECDRTSADYPNPKG
jgi:hypothetical protein